MKPHALAPRRGASGPSLAVALGGGGARGLAHIVVLEALDELGLPPCAIAGTSMGAIVGGAYASGLRAREIRAFVGSAFRNRSQVMANLLRARVGRFSDLLFKGGGNPVLLDAITCLDLFWPAAAPETFEDLKIPLSVVATDFHACEQVVYASGPLAPAVAASMSIPGLFRPIDFGGRVLVDGGAVNPLPYDLLFDRADIVVAVDVTFGGRMRERKIPTSFGAMFGTAQIMQGSITAAKIRLRPPDLLLRPPVARFSVLDFLRATQILRHAEVAKDEMKRLVTQTLEEKSRA